MTLAMLSPVDGWLVAALALAGVVLAALAARGLRATGTLLRRRTSRVGALVDGPVELVGVVRAPRAPVTDGMGRPCVAFERVEYVLVQAGKGSAWRESSRERFVADAEIADDSGVCALDLQGAELVGDAWVSESAGHPKRRTVETVVPAGARVTVLGEAAAVGLVEGSGYRDARAKMCVRGGARQKLLVVTSGHLGTLARTAAPALVTGVAAVALLGLAVALAAASAHVAAGLPR